jgi:hypothetical protein
MESRGNGIISILAPFGTVNIVGASMDTFTGTGQETIPWNTIHTVLTAQYPGSLRVYHSIDNSLWGDIVDVYNYPPDTSVGVSGPLNVGMFNITPVKAKYCRVQFTNTSDFSSNMRLQTMLHSDSSPSSIVANITASGSADTMWISGVWQSNCITDIVTVSENPVRLYSVYASNYNAPDNRYVKLYDVSGDVSLASNVPKQTIPLFPNVPQDLNLGGNRGVYYANGVKVSVTRGISAGDNHFDTIGNVLVTILYDEVVI